MPTDNAIFFFMRETSFARYYQSAANATFFQVAEAAAPPTVQIYRLVPSQASWPVTPAVAAEVGLRVVPSMRVPALKVHVKSFALPLPQATVFAVGRESPVSCAPVLTLATLFHAKIKFEARLMIEGA